MNDRGYIIIERTDEYLRKYRQHPDIKKFDSQIQRLRKSFNFLDYEKYKGIGKTIFDSMPYFSLQDTEKEINDLVDNPSDFDNLIARGKLAQIEFNDSDFNDPEIEFFFKHLIDAESTFDLIENKEKFEILSLDWSGNSNLTDSTLGFDIGWLTGYSIICDTCIAPMWHPPEFDDMEDILELCKKLNDNFLFDSYKNALEFKELYDKKDWGEKGDFEIFRIDKAE